MKCASSPWIFTAALRLLLLLFCTLPETSQAQSRRNLGKGKKGGGADCEQHRFLASNFDFLDTNPPGQPPPRECNDFGGVTRCPGTKQTLSATFVDEEGNSGLYNIADTFTTMTDATNFVRHGHGSFVIRHSLLSVQTFQTCRGGFDDCDTYISITGGTGQFACATGTVDFEGTNNADEILYIANVCTLC
mmetsp:Transcript_19103/g.52391  ORF Transcript_19103/g.52391 Transcript_19103/m.52391 type:complete len:190 (-) Transcript_19103:2166-2735(-)